MKCSKLALLAVVVVTLSGCGKELLRNFTCSSADFNVIQKEATRYFGAGAHSKVYTDKDSYLFVAEANSKIAETCPVAVRKACSHGHESLGKNDNAVLGPIQSFGVNATSQSKSVFRHDGMARFTEVVVSFRVEINPTTFQNTAACYRKSATR